MDVTQNYAVVCPAERGGPSAPPPSPSLGSKRRHGIVPISTLLDLCCEELSDKTCKMDIDVNDSENFNFSNNVPVKRKRTEPAVSTFCTQFNGHLCSQESHQCGPKRPSGNFSGHFLVSSVGMNTYSIGSKA